MKRDHLPGAGLFLGAALALLVGCGGEKPGAEPAKTSAPSSSGAPAANTTTAAATAATTAAPSSAPSSTAAASPAGDYPMGDLKPIPSDCARPRVLLTSGPAKLGLEFPWPLAKQVLLAHDSFHVVKSKPSKPGEIFLGTHEVEKIGYGLVAECKDAETCNKLAAMYKGVMRSSTPQPYCGKMGGLSDEPKDSGFEWSANKKDNLPKDDEVQSQCARVTACMIKADHSIPGDPYLECQKSPVKFKPKCPEKETCSEVLACAK
jgi:hypothetical protein